MTPTSSAILAPGPIYHSGYVVKSLDAAIERWAIIAGAGPFVRFNDFHFVNPQYRGSASGPVVNLAFGYSGQTCIELIEPLDSDPSIYSEKPTDIHHVGIAVESIDTSLAPYLTAGIQCAFRGGFAFGGGCAYLDTRSQLGCFVELVERNDIIDGMLLQIQALHNNWNHQQFTATL
jgi:Glyoxalase/Bleomycin resistance protein/Dioxygenase superfamily